MKDIPPGTIADTGILDRAGATSRPTAVLLLSSTGFAALMVAAAHLKLFLPFTPVPVTLQTFVVLLAGLCLGATWGGLSQVQYVMLGLLGVPAFVGGVTALAGPSGGYIVGFVVAATVVGWVYSSMRSTAGAILACLAGTGVIYVFGCVWLMAITGGPLAHVLAVGVVPFLPGDLLKLAAAIAIVRGPFVGGVVRRIFHHS